VAGEVNFIFSVGVRGIQNVGADRHVVLITKYPVEDQLQVGIGECVRWYAAKRRDKAVASLPDSGSVSNSTNQSSLDSVGPKSTGELGEISSVAGANWNWARAEPAKALAKNSRDNERGKHDSIAA
jgi:hypothetical protein